ncbi:MULTISPECIES: DUF805 domain-containing protein [Acinetobacter]|jgi:uncharacterized membrane protein YhaH (DUF805 family)|uniref:DUF805 domain-containing protein n=2 Tax=Acinetobacter TaxID=469 RepID=N9RCL2_9GAMM|nr:MULTISPECIES: DUF805 domain-containing protein [Acinetobacter]RSN82250.1 DUF805 domain-containing protein [Acinetobacter baumannii]ENX40091.1 hypothetical protein F888_00732 [Acinetobacter courvalinii]KAB0660771.1 DUF805 domain-containing protein [Acinetobacter courvalinii]MEB3791250.1 DUF805 domain-containing protein [Acinetobacter sp. IK40]GGH36948.1 DUF805 domain-containing protein [Acinetobacter courvalinii]
MMLQPVSKHLSNPFNPQGRFGRLSYLAWQTVIFLIMIPLNIYLSFEMFGIGLDQPHKQPDFLALFLWLILALFFVYSSIIFAIRRLHDCNRSGWFVLLFAVPYLNLLMLLYLLLAKGNQDSNQYAPLHPTATWEKVMAYIGLSLMFILSVLMFLVLMKNHAIFP